MTAPFAIRFSVRFRDVDMMQHVNNAVYFTYMETARSEYWIHLFGPDGFKTNSFIVVHAECDYWKPAVLGEELEVSIRTSRMGTSSFDWDYEIRNAKTSELYATGKTVQVFYNYTTKKSRRLPESIRQKLV